MLELAVLERRVTVLSLTALKDHEHSAKAANAAACGP